MTVKALADQLSLTTLCMPEGDREMEGGYCGDLLSWVMSRAKSGDAWVTIMTNVNVVAVATLTEPAAIILAEGVTLQDDAVESADENGITVISSPLPAYEICVRLHESGQGRGA